MVFRTPLFSLPFLRRTRAPSIDRRNTRCAIVAWRSVAPDKGTSAAGVFLDRAAQAREYVESRLGETRRDGISTRMSGCAIFEIVSLREIFAAIRHDSPVAKPEREGSKGLDIQEPKLLEVPSSMPHSLSGFFLWSRTCQQVRPFAIRIGVSRNPKSGGRDAFPRDEFEFSIARRYGFSTEPTSPGGRLE